MLIRFYCQHSEEVQVQVYVFAARRDLFVELPYHWGNSAIGKMQLHEPVRFVRGTLQTRFHSSLELLMGEVLILS